MSCNNSSNINLTQTYVTVTNGGSRLLIRVPDSKCATGVTLGSVIRYDPTANSNTGQYKLSRANTIENSEVVGIVESLNTDNSKNVVIYGSIDLPSNSIEDIPVGYSGGSGGSDIYFLSPTTSGKIRNSAPTDLNDVIKPIYQKAPHGNGSYTGVVVNYIGYKINSEEYSSSTQTSNTFNTDNILDGDTNSGIGLLKLLLVNENESFTIPDTFVDASISHLLPATDYPEYYSYFGYLNQNAFTRYVFSKSFAEYAQLDDGYTVNGAYVGYHIVRFISQYDAYSYSKIIDIDYANNAYILSHNSSNEDIGDFNYSQKFVTATGTRYFIVPNFLDNPDSAEIDQIRFKSNGVIPYGMYTPIINFNSNYKLNDLVDFNGNKPENMKVIVLLKVKNEIEGNIQSAETNSFSSDVLKINNEDIGSVLTDFETRVTQLETRFLI